MDDDLEQLVANVEALHAGPDDVVVVTSSHAVSDATRERLWFELQERLPGRQVLVLCDGLQISTLGQQRQLERIERSLAAVQAAIGSVLQVLTKDEEPALARSLDGELFSFAERDQTQPL